MSGSTTDRPRARRPSGLLGMLVLVASVEAALAGHRLDLSTPLSEDWRFASWAASHRAADSRVLFLGDSLVKYALLPRAFRARSGLKAYNLATAGGTIPSSFFVFRQAIESGARPDAVVVDFAALQLADPDPPEIRSYPELATVRDCLDLALASRSPDFFGLAALGKLLPSCKWRFELRRAITAALDGRSTSSRMSSPFFQAMWSNERGAQPMHPAPGHPSANDYLVDGVSPRTWSCPPRDEGYIDRFASLAEAHGITVFWLLPPLAPEVHARRARRGTDESYARFARAKAEAHPNLVILDARASGYDDSVHIDHLHLDHHGAAVLSADVTSAVLDRIAGKLADRWVSLPPYAGRTGLEPSRSVARSVEPSGTTR